MMLRTAVVFLANLMAATVAWIFVSAIWAEEYLIGRKFRSTSEWWSSFHVANLLDECLVLLLAGVILGLCTRSTRPFWWGFGFGVAFGAIKLALSRMWFAEDAPWSAYLWAYSSYYIPPLVCGVAAWIGSAWRNRNRRDATRVS